jgi:hypothetical protein
MPKLHHSVDTTGAGKANTKENEIKNIKNFLKKDRKL